MPDNVIIYSVAIFNKTEYFQKKQGNELEGVVLSRVCII